MGCTGSDGPPVSDGCGEMTRNVHVAAQSGNVAEFRRLVAAGADVETLGEGGAAALHQAGDAEAADMLVQLGANAQAVAGSATHRQSVCDGARAEKMQTARSALCPFCRTRINATFKVFVV